MPKILDVEIVTVQVIDRGKAALMMKFAHEKFLNLFSEGIASTVPGAK
ncbi:MAG: hypothetical protein AAF394_10950 [Planctomycetota bacterium]